MTRKRILVAALLFTGCLATVLPAALSGREGPTMSEATGGDVPLEETAKPAGEANAYEGREICGRTIPSPYYMPDDVEYYQSGHEFTSASIEPELPDAITLSVDSDAHRTLARAAEAYRTKLAVIADNLANAQTPGFKRVRVELENLPPRHEQMPGAMDSTGNYASVGISVGLGAHVAGTSTDFSQGAFRGGGQLDVAISGGGFFQVTGITGELLYTRTGSFSKNANGDLAMSSSGTSRLLEPAITIPADATNVVVTSDGCVSVAQPGSTGLTQVGQVELARFVNPQGLLRKGENLLAETQASGSPTTGNPGQEGLGTLQQGELEASNVDAAEELIEWKRTTAQLKMIQQLLQIEIP